MAQRTPSRNRGLPAIEGAIALVVILLMVQIWLLSATLDAFLAGYPETALPGAIVSLLLFLGCDGTYRFVSRLEKQDRYLIP